MVEAETDIALNFKGGGSVVSHRPCFSVDANNIFACWKNSVLEYSTKTGKLVYEYKDESKSIVGFSYHIYDSYHCLTTCSKKGKVTVWKTVTHYKLLEKQIPLKRIEYFNIITSENEDDLKALVCYRKKENMFFAKVNIKQKTFRNYEIELDRQKYFIDMSGNQYFSFASGNTVYFVRFSNFKKISSYSMSKKRSFTCIACHPSEEVVLTGDSSGRVVVWQNIFSREKVQAVFHWHALPVRSVCFSTAGSYFYSGGEECVLVKWQFDDGNNRRFLPRIAAEIEHISVANNNIYVAIATSDNAIRILDSQMEQVTLIQHLVLGKQHKCGIVYDPRTKALIMNGNQGQVQLYSPYDMSLLYNVDIVGQNKITNEREFVIENTEVTNVAINKSGMWLATVEERKDEKYHGEIRLKFWKFDNEAQKFELNTSVEYPHEKSVNSMSFQPVNFDNGLLCVTVGDDKKFKVWQLDEITTVYRKGVAWNCLGVGFFRNLPCCGLSFSVDGSLIATGFGSVLTAWTPDSCELKCSLIHPSYKEKIKYVQFGYSNQCHLLVSAGTNQLGVWNLLTLCMIWAVPVHVSLLVADPLSTHMAVITNNKEVIVFSPISPIPLYSSKTLLKKQDNVVAATFIPSKYSNDGRLKWYERSHLYIITAKNELFYISSSEDTTEMLDDTLYEDNIKSTFSLMMPSSKANLAQPSVPHKHLYEKDVAHKALKKYLEAPIHTMVPIRFACHALLKSLIVQKEDVS